MAEIIYVSNDNLLRAKGLRNASTGAWINDATVTVTVTDSAGSNVGGSPSPTWPLTLDYEAGSDGNYSATLQNTLTLTVGSQYTATVSITGDSLQAVIVMLLRAKTRTD